MLQPVSPLPWDIVPSNHKIIYFYTIDAPFTFEPRMFFSISKFLLLTFKTHFSIIINENEF